MPSKTGRKTSSRATEFGDNMEEKFVINGGIPLKGEVSVGGAKNAAVAILPATLLAADEYTIENVPHIDDVLILLSILKRLGAKVEFLDRNTVHIDTRAVSTGRVHMKLAKRLRASYYFVGSLIGRFKDVVQRLPIRGCAFHCYHLTAIFIKPVSQCKKFSGCCTKLTYLMLVAFL